jgi:hypothetical protein
LCELDLPKYYNLRVKTYPHKITTHGFEANLGGWNESIPRVIGVNWLEIPANDPEFQCGTYSTSEERDWENARNINTRAVTFARPFRAPPKVVVWLNEFDLKFGHNWRVKVYATDVRHFGFTLHIDSCEDSVLYIGGVSWVAYSAEKPGICSGTVSTVDQRPADQPQRYNGGWAGFGENIFQKAPRVILGINSLGFQCGRNLSLRVGAENVNMLGMLWHANAWGDSVLYSVGISYIAMV